MEILLFLIAVGLFVRWLMIRSRLNRLQQQLDELTPLARRMKMLEAEVAALRSSKAAAPAIAPGVPVPAPVPVIVTAEPPPAVVAPVFVAPPLATPEPVEHYFCQWCGTRLESSAVCACRALPESAAALTPPPLPAYAMARKAVPAPEPVAPGPTFSERMRERMGGEEWEALVGGSLLNKLGVLVLVIGIALFLGYSFTQLGAAGRAAIGFAVSLAMLVGGFVVARRERYRAFATGLLGGGWAALYLTTYAAQAVDATRIIHSPLLGGLLLLAVATGMIVHSLRYQSQTLTGLAYFVAFVSLGVTPMTSLSVVALLPLAGSMLYVAYRFNWSGMALFGLLATYGTLMSRGDSGSPAWQAQIIFTLYWLLFEAFDLIRASRRTPYALRESLILPLNALAFAGLSYLKWSKASPDQLYLVAAAVAGAYFASAILRTRLCPPSSFPADTTSLSKIFSGGYEGPITIAAALSAVAVLLRFQGGWAGFGLLIEAECLFIAGLVFAERYPKQLAAALFGVELLKLFAVDAVSPARTTLGAWSLHAWTPITILSAAVFYLNRYLDRAAIGYSWAASAVIALVIGFETPERFLGMAWFVLAATLFTFGWMKRLQEFRLQAYCAATLGLGGTGYHQTEIAAGNQPARQFPWIPLGLSAALGYAAVWCALRSPADRLPDAERNGLRRVGSWAVTILLALLAVRVVPLDYIGVAWIVLAIPLLELGVRGVPADFKTQAFALAAIGSAAVAIVNLIPLRNVGPLAGRMIALQAAIAAYAFAARIWSARESSRAMNVASGSATVFACAGLWAVLPPVAAGPAWAALAITLVEVGVVAGMKGIERQGHVVAAAAFTRLFFSNFTNSGVTGLLSHRIVTVVPVAAAFYYVWQRIAASRLARYYLHAATILIFVLLRFELGRTLTVTGWSALAVIVLALGQRKDIADFRWQAYLIAAAAFVRSLTTNFYAPELLGGVPGRIATGVFVILCLYTAQVMLPMPSIRSGIERYARTYFALLATVLTSVLLIHEVSGSVLTVAWGLQSIVLLGAGFPLRDRTLRLSGLFLFLVCILKLFIYDLRNLDTGYRILSFIVLGLMLLSVSWIYTRFRDRIQRFL